MTIAELLSLYPKTKTTKEIIIHILGNRWPLSPKEIHNSLIKEQGISSSYQATHKSIRELEEKGILYKEERKYKLSQDWIQKSKNYFHRLAISYEKHQYAIESEKIIKFTNYTDFSLTLANMFDTKKLIGPNYTDGYILARHLYWPLKFDFRDFELCKSVAFNAKPHIISQYSAPFDKLIKKYYKLAQWPEVVIGSDIQVEEDFVVQGHTIVQIKYSENTKQKLDKIWNKVHNLADLFGQYMQKNSDTEMEIEMKITQNGQLAGILIDKIKKEIQDHSA